MIFTPALLNIWLCFISGPVPMIKPLASVLQAQIERIL